MKGNASWTRRAFVQSLGSLCAIGGLSPFTSRSPSSENSLNLSTLRFAFIASAQDVIHTFTILRDGSWHLTQQMSSPAPASLALSPDQRFLYVANALESFQHRPTGSVESYAIDPYTGHLSIVNRQALTLSSTRPRHIAVSPNGRLLAVAAEGGAAYNLLPILHDGSIGTVTASLKPLVGTYLPTTPRASLSSAILFERNNAFLATDMGRGRTTSLAIDEDLALALNGYHDFAQSGESIHMVVHPTAERHFVAGSHDSTISMVSRTLHVLQELKLSSGKGSSALAVHPSGNMLFAATTAGISVINIDNSGVLRASASFDQMPGDIDRMVCSRDGLHLFATTRSRSVFRMQINHQRNALSSPLKLASIPSLTAIAFHYA